MPVPVVLQQLLTLILILCLRPGSRGEGRGGLRTTEPLRTPDRETLVSCIRPAQPSPGVAGCKSSNGQCPGDTANREHDQGTQTYSFCPNHKHLNVHLWASGFTVSGSKSRHTCSACPSQGMWPPPYLYPTHSPTGYSDNWQEEEKGGGRSSFQGLANVGTQKTPPLLVRGASLLS